MALKHSVQVGKTYKDEAGYRVDVISRIRGSDGCETYIGVITKHDQSQRKYQEPCTYKGNGVPQWVGYDDPNRHQAKLAGEWDVRAELRAAIRAKLIDVMADHDLATLTFSAVNEDGVIQVVDLECMYA